MQRRFSQVLLFLIFFDPVFGGVVLTQTFTPTVSGRFAFFVDYASFNPIMIGANLDAGVISLQLNDLELDSISLGRIEPQETLRGTLSGQADLFQGVESVFSVTMIRGSRSSDNSPVIHIDNAQISPTAVPLPLTFNFFILGIMTFGALRFRNRSAQ